MKGKTSLSFAAAAALLAAAVLFTGTLAYLIYGKDAENAFTAGQNTIEIAEEYEPPRELTIGENEFQKRVRVENTGTVSCFVRVFAEFSDSSIRDLSFLSPDGSTYFPAEEYANHLPPGWVYIGGEDELLAPYYYYTEPLMPGESTPVLFDSVKTVIDDASQIRDYEIIVYAESVQTADTDGNELTGANAFAQAWREFLSRR